MTATLEPLSADEVYDLALEPRRRAPARRVLLGALDLWCAMTGGRMELTRAGDLVVRRHTDGAVELTVPLQSADDAPALVAIVRDQMETLTPEEFRAAWGLG